MSTMQSAGLALTLNALEIATALGFGAAGNSQLPHGGAVYTRQFQIGTGNGNVDTVYSKRHSIVSGVPLDLDLRTTSAIVSQLDGTALNFPLIVGILVVNNSTTTGQNLTLGQGSNPVTTYLTGTTPGIIIGPGGCHFLCSPQDGYATTATTADVLRLAASTGTIVADVLILGRQS